MRPCIGILGENKLPNNGNVKMHEYPVPRYVSKKCNVWSAEAYPEEKGNLFGSVCQSCKEIASELGEIDSVKSMSDTDVSSQIKEEFHQGLMVKPDIDALQNYDVDFDKSCINQNDEEFFSELDEGQFSSEINNETANLAMSRKRVAKSGKKKLAKRKRLEAALTDYHYTGPIAVNHDEVTRELKVIPVQETVHNLEYIGDMHPFHEEKDWMAIFFPQAENPICPLCHAQFRSSVFLILHLKLKHAFDWYQCSECKIWRNQPSDIISHCDELHEGVDTEHMCPCCKTSIRSKELEEHCLSCFPIKYSKRNLASGRTFYRSQLHNCQLCSGVFKNITNYRNHLRSNHDSEAFKCDIDGCDYITTRGFHMNTHKLKVHKENRDPTEAPSEPKMCDICGRKFSTLGNLINHRKNEHNALTSATGEFPCPECDETFGSKNTRYSHINTVHVKISFDCVECGKSFALKEKLKQHKIKVHSKEKIKAQCTICLKWFSNKEYCDNHVRREHTGERPFICLFCDSAFYSATQLWFHRKRLHPDSWAAEKKRRIWLKSNKGKDSDEYKIQCHLCDQTTQTIDALRSHWDEVHPGETDLGFQLKYKEKGPHICEHCGHNFPTAKGLFCHMYKAHRKLIRPKFEPKVFCEICGKGFAASRNLIIHKSRKHEIKLDRGDKPKPQSKWKKYYLSGQSLLCDICGSSFSSAFTLRNHKEGHANDANKPKNCTYCDKQFPTFNQMTSHRRCAHAKEYAVDKEKLQTQEGSKYLGREHPSKTFLHPKEKRTCTICERTLCSRQQLHLHMKALHGTGLPGYVARK